MTSLLDKLYGIGVIPVVTLAYPHDAIPLALALIGGGLRAAEITFRTPAAAGAIVAIKAKFPCTLIGGGTIISKSQIIAACDAGADFLVAPGFNPAVAELALKMNMPFIPGCVTPSEVEQALDMGIELVKFFPAEAFGARAVIEMMQGPYPQMHFMPTGGITYENVGAYLEAPNVACCGGSWIAPHQLIDTKNFDAIRKNASDVVGKVRAIRGEPNRELSIGL